jgi:hypothetical protein
MQHIDDLGTAMAQAKREQIRKKNFFPRLGKPERKFIMSWLVYKLGRCF